MSEPEMDKPDAAAFAALKAHAETLERQLRDAEVTAAVRLRQSELKAEAVRAGIVDLDGLKLIDEASSGSKAHGAGDDAAAVIAKLRRDKPWLFVAASSSSVAAPPQAAAPRRKLATEMSVDEWRAARAELLRRR